jgi:hypothetical protein
MEGLTGQKQGGQQQGIYANAIPALAAAKLGIALWESRIFIFDAI